MEPIERLAEAEESRVSADLEFVAALQRRDRKATADFVAMHADAIYRYVRFRLIPRSDLAEDIVQEIFLAAWANLGRFQGSSSLQSWLLGIARHKIEDYYRSRLRQSDSIESDDREAAHLPANEPTVDEFIDRGQMDERVQTVLSSLPESYAMALLWRYWEERSTRDMAALIGKTEKAVERLLARAREQFKGKWNHEQTP